MQGLTTPTTREEPITPSAIKKPEKQSLTPSDAKRMIFTSSDKESDAEEPQG